MLPPNTIIAIKPGVILPYAEADRSAMQGSSVAQSADGSTAIAGALANNRVIGAAWVHTRSDGVWTETHLGF